MRDGALVKKQLPDGRWIYGRAYVGSENWVTKSRVRVFKDQGWWVGGYPVLDYRSYDDENMEGWREVYSCDGDPMHLREEVLEIFEGADIHVTDGCCPENQTEEIEELYVEDHDRSRVFMEVYEAICKAEGIKPKLARYDVIVKPTVEQAKKEP